MPAQLPPSEQQSLEKHSRAFTQRVDEMSKYDVGETNALVIVQARIEAIMTRYDTLAAMLPSNIRNAIAFTLACDMQIVIGRALAETAMRAIEPELDEARRRGDSETESRLMLRYNQFTDCL